MKILMALALSALMLVLPAQAEQKMQVGKYAIHYAAFGSTFLTPTIAKTYGLTRSRFNGLVNITVLDTSQTGPETHAVPLTISGTARNLVGSIRELDFHEIREGTAIYYIAEFKHSNEEAFFFDIQLSNGSDLNTKLRFEHKYYAD
ncbi:DUF4426 domain-containing protein [Ferrimonas gelatinilytica]|uniref:DUF4426 domain-containing protein n=1 Tax=Ferrimonas gelatinilytica TaxID=1255257 RepID=A0ABP9S2Z4_9GAMM